MSVQTIPEHIYLVSEFRIVNSEFIAFQRVAGCGKRFAAPASQDVTRHLPLKRGPLVAVTSLAQPSTST